MRVDIYVFALFACGIRKWMVGSDDATLVFTFLLAALFLEH